MKNIDQIKKGLSDIKDLLHKRYGVSRMDLFGSYVRGEQREKSDIDVLVEFDRDVSLLDIAGLENYLSDHLGIKADVVLRRSVRKELKDVIFGEAVPV